MSKNSSKRSSNPVSATSSHRSHSSTASTKGRYLRPVPYATTLALEQFFDGGTMEQHIARRTTASAKPSPLSPHHQSRRQSRQSSALVHPQQQQQPQRHSTSNDQRSSKHHESSHKAKAKTKTSNRPASTQQIAPVVTGAERAIGKGASLPVVDEKGQVWYDWEEKQEFAPLITVEHERSGWVNFPGATGRSSSITSSSSGGDEGGARGCDSVSASPIRPTFPLSLPLPLPLPLHTVLDAFTFAGDGAGTGTGGGGGGGGCAPAAGTIDPKDPMHGLQAPPGARPRGKDRRIVRRVDSLPSLLDQAEQKEAAAREFFDASFDPVQAMRTMQQQQQQRQQQQPQHQQDATAAAAATEDASTAENKQLAFGKRASVSMKGFKKLFSRKKSTSA